MALYEIQYVTLLSVQIYNETRRILFCDPWLMRASRPYSIIKKNKHQQQQQQMHCVVLYVEVGMHVPLSTTEHLTSSLTAIFYYKYHSLKEEDDAAVLVTKCFYIEHV